MPVFGVIDVGSNAMKMRVARCEPPGQINVLCEEREPVRLGTGAFLGQGIPTATVDKAADAMVRFRQLMEVHQAEHIRAVATAALREAPNRDEVLARLLDRSGVALEVITGAEEARLIQAGTTLDVDSADGAVLFVDIGGGSCELSVREDGESRELRSLKLGAVRLTEHFLGSDPVTPADHRKLKDYIYSEVRLNTEDYRRYSFRRVIGTAGTIRAICDCILEQPEVYPRSSLHGVRYADISSLHWRVRRMPLAERRNLPGISGNRADILVAGAAVLKYVMKQLRVQEIVPSRRGLRDGLLLDLLSRQAPDAAMEEEFHRSRMKRLRKFAVRFDVELHHARRVARLALSLFDGLKKNHGLSRVFRDLLEAAALLHEVGRSVSYDAMHKHSYYIIRNAELTTFMQDEIQLIAAVARFHRKSDPTDAHEVIRSLPEKFRKPAQWLAGILRVADGLDRHREGRVEDLSFRQLSDKVRVELDNNGPVELESWSAKRKGGVLESLLGRPLDFVALNNGE